MQREDATPALSPASAGREHGTDLAQGQLAGASADHGSGVETGAPSTMHYVRPQGTDPAAVSHTFTIEALGTNVPIPAHARVTFTIHRRRPS